MRLIEASSRKKIERTDIEAFLAENFELYKQLCDFHILVLMAELAQLTLKHDVVELAKRIHDRHMPKTLSLHPEQTDSVQKMIIDMMERSVYDISPWQLQVIRTPRLCYAGERDPIWVQESSGKARKIQEHSMLVQSLSNQYEQACLLLVDQAIINRPEVKKINRFYLGNNNESQCCYLGCWPRDTYAFFSCAESITYDWRKESFGSCRFCGTIVRP
ncbi:MAG: hypothetical protein LRY43_03935 [Gammaproteobacteria bacterium]|nr:hypothetical protein [Gammaproteobacteria bacterium]